MKPCVRSSWRGHHHPGAQSADLDGKGGEGAGGRTNQRGSKLLDTSPSYPGNFSNLQERGWGWQEGTAELPLIYHVMFSDVPFRGTGWAGETKDFSTLKYDFVIWAFKFNLDFHRDCKRATHRSLA